MSIPWMMEPALRLNYTQAAQLGRPCYLIGQHITSKIGSLFWMLSQKPMISQWRKGIRTCWTLATSPLTPGILFSTAHLSHQSRENAQNWSESISRDCLRIRAAQNIVHCKSVFLLQKPYFYCKKTDLLCFDPPLFLMDNMDLKEMPSRAM